MHLAITLPSENRLLRSYQLRNIHGSEFTRDAGERPFTRVVYSAAHVAVDQFADHDPWSDAPIDWDATMAYRRYLWSLGLGVAEAMDTAQRGTGLDWTRSFELIRHTLNEAKYYPGAAVASGCGTDQLAPGAAKTIDDIIRAYSEQIEAIESLGGTLIVMASRELARIATGPADYERVYSHILQSVRQPVILHWLGEMFDPALQGYWGFADHNRATDIALGIIAAHADKVDGIKISLLDESKEVSMRRRLPPNVRMYTGDDFNYPNLIAGDGRGEQANHAHSHALLGIFDVIAPAASAALEALARDDTAAFHHILSPTLPLSRHIFRSPTRFYKTGVVFMAWLNGHQDHFLMAGGQQSARSAQHFAELFKLADKAGALRNPEMAVERMKMLMGTFGVTNA